jgi:hypothetical protein
MSERSPHVTLGLGRGEACGWRAAELELLLCSRKLE